jgi:DNA polymerase-3 subunit epsilon
MNIIFIDCETSGLNPLKHSVVQIAAEYWEGTKLIQTFNKQLTNQDCIINLGALKCNRCTIDQIRASNTEERIVRDFVDFIMKMDITKPIVVCGNGVSFDINFIKELLAKYKIEGLEHIFSHKVYDLSAIALFLQECEIIDFKDNFHLNNIAKVLGIEVKEDKLHEALYDVSISRQVYFKMQELVKGTIDPLFKRFKEIDEEEKLNGE